MSNDIEPDSQSLRLPIGYGPDVARVTRVIVRELERLIIPELKSERALVTGGMIASVLRHHALIQDGRVRRVSAADSTMPLDALGQVTATAREQVRGELHDIDVAASLEAGLPGETWDPEFERLQSVTPERLTAYLRNGNFANSRAITIRAVKKLLSGFSKESFLVDAIVDDAPLPLVMRRDATYPIVETTVIDEFALLRALHSLGLAVAEPLVLETDKTVFAAPFFIMARAPGRVVAANTQGIATGPKQARAARELAAFLGKLHRLELHQLNLRSPVLDSHLSMEQHLLREVEHAESAHRRYRRDNFAIFDTGFAWLRTHLPKTAGERPRIVHGDAGLHNLMTYRGRISAMLDWELTHAGDPMEDLVFCRTWVDRALPWDDFLKVYYANGGAPYKPERESFFAILSDIRVAGIWAERCNYNFARAEQPELSWAYAATMYHRLFAKNVAQRLLSLDQ
jgi:aminoglycoside phosphotransferase (APT) family kinase protein